MVKIILKTIRNTVKVVIFVLRNNISIFKMMSFEAKEEAKEEANMGKQQLRGLLLVLILLFLGHHAKCQTIIDKDLWYIWIDAEVTVNNETKRIITNKVISLTCCLRSRKFRKYQKNIEKDIQRKYDSAFALENGLKKSNNEAFAKEQLRRVKTQYKNKLVLYDIKKECHL